MLSPLGERAGPARQRPDALRRRARLGGQAAAARGLPGPRGAGWASPQLQLVDLQYSDVRPEKGLYHRLVARGSMQRLLDRRRGDRARWSTPPEDTRAYFRGECLRRYPAEVAAASWDSVIFDVGRESLVRVPMMEPLRGTREHVGALFDRCPRAKDLLEALTGRADPRRSVPPRRMSPTRCRESPHTRRVLHGDTRDRRSARAGPARRTEETDEVEASAESSTDVQERHEKSPRTSTTSSTRSTRSSRRTRRSSSGVTCRRAVE